MMGTLHNTHRSPSVPIRGSLAALFAVLATVAISLGVDALDITPAFRAVPVPPVAFLSALGAGGATIVYWPLDRFLGDGIEQTTTALAVVALVASHVVVAAVSVRTVVNWRAE